MKKRAVQAFIFTLCIAMPPCASADAPDILARSRAAYAALKSYTDTGVIETEYRMGDAPAIRERHTFITRFRKPRHFYYEFNEDPKAGAERFVVWSDAAVFSSWWSTTGVESTFPKGRGANAFVTGSGPTKGSLLNIAPWLFPDAGLQGVLTAFTDAAVEGEELIAGRKCQRLKGVQRVSYGQTGHELPPRRTTLWIDAQTLLVCKIFEDTPRGVPVGTVSRITTLFQPKSNPSLTDAQFRFVAPTQE